MGHVIGSFGQCGAQGPSDSFIWTGGDSLTIIQRPAGILSFSATDINDYGLITGVAVTTTAGQRGYIYNSSTGAWTELPPPNPGGQGWSSANSINNSGQVCGYRSLNDGGDPVNPWQAFVWDPVEGFTDFGLIDGLSTIASDINDAALTVGRSGNSGIALNARGFLYQDGKLSIVQPLSGMLNSNVPFVDNAGRYVIAGITQQSPVLGVAYMCDDGDCIQMQPLNELPTLQVRGMNNNQVVVGNSGNPSMGMTGTAWFQGFAVDLNVLAQSRSEIIVHYGRDVNDGGQIIAWASVDSDPALVLLQPMASIAGDTNCDGIVDIQDLLTVMNGWGKCSDSNKCEADVAPPPNGNGTVDVDDLLIVINNWNF